MDMVAVHTADQLSNIVGPEHARAGVAGDAVEGVTPQSVIEPANAPELAQCLSVCNEAGIAVIPCGGRTKIDWGNRPRALNVLLNTCRQNRVIEHAAGDMTSTVQAGCTVAGFQATLARNGQRLAVDVHWPRQATIGGILATNDSGMLRHAFGPLRDSLIGITVALADGTLARSGGKVVKNVAGYDLPKLFIGSFGTLGVIVEATFRLYPLPHAERMLSYTFSDAIAMGAAMDELRASSQLAAGMQFEIGQTTPPKLCVRVEALASAIDEKCRQVNEKVMRASGDAIGSSIDTSQARESLFADADACVCKISLLPTDWRRAAERIAKLSGDGRDSWKLVGQAMGVGLLRLGGSDRLTMTKILGDLRREMGNMGGHLVILRASPAIKAAIDTWGDIGDSLPVMQAIKRQFDPKQSLSPGRFVGGI